MIPGKSRTWWLRGRATPEYSRFERDDVSEGYSSIKSIAPTNCHNMRAQVVSRRQYARHYLDQFRDRQLAEGIANRIDSPVHNVGTVGQN